MLLVREAHMGFEFKLKRDLLTLYLINLTLNQKLGEH